MLGGRAVSNTIMVFDPTAPFLGQGAMAPRRIETIEGKVVGFIDNGKPNFDVLVADLGALLIARYGVRSVRTHRKRTASQPAADAVLEELTGACEAVIAGSGD